MKKLLYSFVLLFAALAFVACDSGNDDPITPGEGEGGGTAEASIQQFSSTLSNSDAITLSYSFNAAENWRVKNEAGWCKVTPMQGTAGDARKVSVDVLENRSADPRETHIVIETIATTQKFVEITITQPGRESAAIATAPVQATMPEAKRLFEYLHSVYGEKTLSSTIANVNWNISEAELVHTATGKWPAIATFDYIHLSWSPANWIDYTNTKVVEDWWNAGGIVSACWHWNVPCTEADMAELNRMTCTPGNGNPNADGSLTTAFLPKNIFVDGTWEKRFADETLAKMADMLLLLQAKGIPVIWRPLHEAAGNTYADWNPSRQPLAWFWWGRDGAETYQRLWRHMFDYFASRGLTNLIWVFTGDTHDTPYYPGDAYVDIIGCDMYNNSNASAIAAQYNGVADIYSNKFVTLSEMGNLARISAQWNAGARWLYFMPWYHYDAKTLDGHQHADAAWWRDAMAQPFVVTRDQLPIFK